MNVEFNIEDKSKNITDGEAATIKKEIIDTNNRFKDFFEKIERLDDIDKKLAEDFVFDYVEKKTKSGRLIIFGDVTINMDYVANISISSLGTTPNIRLHEDLNWMRDGKNYRTCSIDNTTNASIDIVYNSGKNSHVVCSRHVVEIVYAGLINAWRN